jgi:hypothetical protein
MLRLLGNWIALAAVLVLDSSMSKRPLACRRGHWKSFEAANALTKSARKILVVPNRPSIAVAKIDDECAFMSLLSKRRPLNGQCLSLVVARTTIGYRPATAWRFLWSRMIPAADLTAAKSKISALETWRSRHDDQKCHFHPLQASR